MTPTNENIFAEFHKISLMLDRRSIYAHRGLWGYRREANSLEAISDAFEAGFSVETDLIQMPTSVKIGHDHREGLRGLELNHVPNPGRYALNIKSDEAWRLPDPLLNEIAMSGSFFFDASPPTLRQIAQAGLPFANRVSEIESPMDLASDTLWVDSFSGRTWWANENFYAQVRKLKHLIFVSPELHGFKHIEYWEQLRNSISRFPSDLEVAVCTDFPGDLYLF